MSAFVAPRSLGDVIFVPSVSNPQQNIALRYAIISSRFFGNNQFWHRGTYAIQQLRSLSRHRIEPRTAHGTLRQQGAMHHHNVSDAHLRFICWRYHNSNCIL